MAFPVKAAAKPRLHVRGVLTGYRRSRLNQNPNQMLMRIHGVQDRTASQFYMGKKVGYYYKAGSKKNGSYIRTVFGKVIAAHGNSGMVRVKFDKNLCANSFTSAVRVFLYPSTI